MVGTVIRKTVIFFTVSVYRIHLYKAIESPTGKIEDARNVGYVRYWR